MSSRPPTDPEDFRKLLSEGRAGSTEALGRLWMSCRQYLLLVARQRLDPALQGKVSPSDVVQQTFLEAQRDLSGFHGDREDELLAWLCRILVNNMTNASRSQQTEMRDVAREVPFPGAGSDSDAAGDLARDTPSPSARAMAREEADALEKGMAGLSDNYRAALRLRYQEGLTFAQIGEKLGCSAEAARKLWARAVHQLQQTMDPPDAP